MSAKLVNKGPKTIMNPVQIHIDVCTVCPSCSIPSISSLTVYYKLFMLGSPFLGVSLTLLNSVNLCVQISFLGDNDGLPIDQTVQRILERMLSNTFAKRMDWRGKNNKVSFASSCLKEIVNGKFKKNGWLLHCKTCMWNDSLKLAAFPVKDAVRRNSVCARAADEAVESVVKKWLQQAGERDEGAEGRREEREVVSI